MQVIDPAGETWRVKRRWLPWRPRLREGSFDLGTNLVGVADEGPILVFLLALVLIPVAVVLAVFLAEIAILLLLIPLFTLVRAMWVRGWPIEVWHGKQLEGVEEIRGWADSRARLLEVAESIRLGFPVPPARHR